MGHAARVGGAVLTESGRPRRVLVTGATGVFGRAAIVALRRRGIEVVGLARSADQPAGDGVTWVAADIRDRASVARAMEGCDSVIHLAWVVVPLRSADEIHDINVGGTESVLAAMTETGCSHLVFASSITAYGSDPAHPHPYREDEALRADDSFHYGADKRRVEALLADRCVVEGWDLTVVRAASVIGRGVTNSVAHVFAGPAIVDVAGHDLRWQFLHPGDLGRFLAGAVIGRLAGTVNLAAPDILSQAEVAQVLDRRLVQVSARAMERLVRPLWALRLVEIDPDSAAAMTAMPTVDTTRLVDDWNFQCAWSSREALADAKATLDGMLQLGSVNLRRPFRLPEADVDRVRPMHSGSGRGLAHAAPTDVRGSLDTQIDVGFPTWTATNLSEAFPGPLTPLSLTLALDTLRAGTDSIVALLGLTGPVAHEARARMVGSFGHHLYVNVDVARASVADVPGMSQSDVDAQYLGKSDGDPSKIPTLQELRSVPGLVRRVVPALAGWGRATRRVGAAADALTDDVETLRDLDVSRLLALADRARAAMADGWTAAIVGNFATGLSNGDGSDTAGPVDGSVLPSAVALDGINRIVDDVRRLGLVDVVAGCEDLDDLRATAPTLAVALDRLVARCGHRGPGEMDLRTPTIGDRPESLLRIIARAAAGEPKPRIATVEISRRRDRLARRSSATRESARDAVVRVQHVIRRTVRELATRWVDSGVLAAEDDVYFLTWDELHDVASVSARTIADRRTEHERLGKLVMPTHFEATWWTGDSDGAVRSVDTSSPISRRIEGIGGAPGIVRGRVRVMTEAHDDLEPGEVMVVHVTDVGWTTLFALASAVVTDIGGSLSHAAIVAREFGIPAVLGTEVATRALCTGQLVEVDGTSGTITVIEEV